LVFEGTVKSVSGAPLRGALVTLGRYGSCVPLAPGYARDPKAGPVTWVTRAVDAPTCLGSDNADDNGHYRFQASVDYPCDASNLWLTASASGYGVAAVTEPIECVSRAQMFDFELVPTSAPAAINRLAAVIWRFLSASARIAG
jgi:hypothetical protein